MHDSNYHRTWRMKNISVKFWGLLLGRGNHIWAHAIVLSTRPKLIVQLGLDFKLNTKIGLDTHHPPPTHPPQTFRPLPGLLGGLDLVCWLYSQIYDYPRYNKRHLSRQHLSWGHLSISAISQLLLARFGSNFKQRVLGTYTTDYNCYHNICPGNICHGDICPYKHYKYIQAERFRLQSYSDF